ncbi:MAG: phosphoribosylformimino-5-aminoimidazole carboxamide ribotide isomerase [Parvicellaceae bacterium]|jgi:phosphoribosylformimino-5-aminoimidazole carboxamide ribotide isomerase
MIQVIPAIDIIEGKCVRLSKGDYSTKKVYNEKPLEVAKQFEAAGIAKLHLVDLDGARSKEIVNWKILELIASKTNLEIDFGGGLKSDNDLRVAFDCGAKQITGGSIAVKDPERFESWLAEYGSDRIILGADAKNEKIAISGWMEESSTNIFDFIDDYVEKGIEYCISTDIDKDGMLEGASHELYARILEKNNGLKLIASGGVVSIDELIKLDEMGLYGAIIGKAIYEGNISLKDLENYISSC